MELNELIATLNNLINAEFRKSNIVEFGKDTMVNKAHLDLEGVVLEKYFGDNKKGYSIRFNEDNFQLLYLNDVIIVNDSDGINSYPLAIMSDEEKEKSVQILQNTINRFSRLNKHK